MPDRARNDDAVTTAAAPTIEAPSLRGVDIVLGYLGWAALVLCLPFVLLLGGPILGWLVGAVLFGGSFAAQRFVGRVTESMDPTQAVGLSGISSIGRAMVVVMILFVVALQGDRTVGLVAGGVFAAAFTFDLMGRAMIFAIHEKDRRTAKAAAAAQEETV
jgi:hypothetical protein